MTSTIEAEDVAMWQLSKNIVWATQLMERDMTVRIIAGAALWLKSVGS